MPDVIQNDNRMFDAIWSTQLDPSRLGHHAIPALEKAKMDLLPPMVGAECYWLQLDHLFIWLQIDTRVGMHGCVRCPYSALT